jgi:hypothetical protein
VLINGRHWSMENREECPYPVGVSRQRPPRCRRRNRSAPFR